jgi:hypothetical protein
MFQEFHAIPPNGLRQKIYNHRRPAQPEQEEKKRPPNDFSLENKEENAEGFKTPLSMS